LLDLDRALALISEEQRRVILLIGLEGTSYEEAATILDVQIGTIRSCVSRGRGLLRKLMDPRHGTQAANGAAITSAAPKRPRILLEDEPTQNSSRAPMVAVGAESITMGSAAAAPITDAWGGVDRTPRAGSRFARVV
jgi:Sigma-70, region 4